VAVMVVRGVGSADGEACGRLACEGLGAVRYWVQRGVKLRSGPSIVDQKLTTRHALGGDGQDYW